MPQIQYPAYTAPPAFTVATVPEMGWRETEPDQQTRDRYRPGYGKGIQAYTALYTPAVAYDFNPENWALPKPLLAKAYLPDNPQQFIDRRSYWGKGGGYQFVDTQSHAVFAVEQWAPKFGWKQAVLPDNPDLFIKRQLSKAHVWWVSDPKTPGEVTLSFAQMELPDDPRLGRRPFTPAAMRFWIAGGQPDTFLVPGWGSYDVDTTSAKRLAVSDIPANAFRGEAPENYPPTLLASVTAPDRVPTTIRQTRIDGFTFTLSEIPATVPTPGWTPIYPDTTRMLPQTRIEGLSLPLLDITPTPTPEEENTPGRYPLYGHTNKGSGPYRQPRIPDKPPARGWIDRDYRPEPELDVDIGYASVDPIDTYAVLSSVQVRTGYAKQAARALATASIMRGTLGAFSVQAGTVARPRTPQPLTEEEALIVFLLSGQWKGRA